uniref:Pentatricopeptide repeat-containing protein At3g24000 n=1 Tax=Rhizophora mucronata TaxID=61149 RepID=A0A2P2IRE8_RHIMU
MCFCLWNSKRGKKNCNTIVRSLLWHLHFSTHLLDPPSTSRRISEFVVIAIQHSSWHPRWWRGKSLSGIQIGSIIFIMAFVPVGTTGSAVMGLKSTELLKGAMLCWFGSEPFDLACGFWLPMIKCTFLSLIEEEKIVAAPHF